MNILQDQTVTNTADSKQSRVKDICNQNDVVMIYFTIPTSIDCSEFSELLFDVYTNLRAEGKRLEILQADCDEIREIYKLTKCDDKRSSKLAWPQLPISCVAALAMAYRVHRVPSLVVLESSGEVISMNYTAQLKRTLYTEAWSRWTGNHIVDRMPFF